MPKVLHNRFQTFATGLVAAAVLATSAAAAPLAASQSTDLRKAKSVSELVKLTSPSDWQAIAADNLVVMDLASGQVVIELAPLFAPKHVENIRALIREGYFDNHAVVRSQENYVVQWGGEEGVSDGAETKKEIKTAKKSLPGEYERKIGADLDFAPMPDQDGYLAGLNNSIKTGQTGYSHTWPVARNFKTKETWLTHCYSMVGAGRGNALDSGNGAELYAMLTTARQLDRNVTMVGRVIEGMPVLSVLPRGTGTLGFYEKPTQRHAIKRVRLVSDLPAAEQPQFEVMKTNTIAFKEYLALRRDQRNEWFRVKTGYVEVCNAQPVVRRK